MVAKQRGRKPKDEYFKNKKADDVQIDKTIIACLPISIEDCMENLNIYRQEEIMSDVPSTPLPYQDENAICYSILQDDDKKYIELQPNKLPIHSSSIIIDSESSIKNEIYETRILPNEISKNNNKNLSFKTSIACFWCCHTFENNPVFMPVELIKDVYKVKGCFCSFECCHSYMMDNSKYQRKRYLLNYMFRDLTGIRGEPIGDKGFTNIVKLGRAPPKESLLMFGGNLSIDEFREKNSTYKNIHFPMVHISNQIERNTIIRKHKTSKEVKPILPPSNNTSIRKTPNNSLSKIIGLKVKNSH